MPNAYVLNQRPNLFGAALSLLPEMLASAGWTYQGSGTGTAGTFAPPPISSTVTISNATPAVVSWAGHNLNAGCAVVFTTSGTLPAPLVPGTTYFVIAAGLTAGTSFQISATFGGSAINTTNAGSGTHTGTSSGKIFISTGTGAGGWSIANAWARMQDPSATREFLFQHNNTGGIKIRYSASSKFVGILGGAVSATIPPTALDERYVWGSSGTFGAWFHASTTTNSYGGGSFGSLVHQGAAMSAAPYGFWFASQVQDSSGASKAKGASLMFDPVDSAPEDTDPYVIQAASSNSFLATTSNLGRDGNAIGTWTTSQTGVIEGCWANMGSLKTSTVTISNATPAVVTWASHGLTVNSSVIFTVSGGTLPTGLTTGTVYYIILAGFTTGSFQVSLTVGGAAINTSSAGSGTFTATGQAFYYVEPAGYAPNVTGATVVIASVTDLVLNPFNSKHEALPFPYVRTSQAAQVPGLKGWSTLARWTTQNRNTFTDTLDNKNWICVGAMWLPWDGLTQPIG